jgi:hypothetical protein
MSDRLSSSPHGHSRGLGLLDEGELTTDSNRSLRPESAPAGPESYTHPRSRSLLAAPWLTIEAGAEGTALVTVAGGIAADRSIDLWSSVEEALEQANGGLVMVDLTRVTGFDIDTINDLIRVAKASARRKLDLCALIRPRSSLEHYAYYSGLSLLLPIYTCAAAALSDTQRPPARTDAG